jgi:tRNA dimethylallyltransferase
MQRSFEQANAQSGQSRTPAICLLGPTASGKTALAIELVKRLPCEIINVDSAQIYRDMDIGTGKPDAATLALAPHRLLGFLDPAQVYSASQFRADALREMADIRALGRIPLLVGGTMLYFKALRDGLAAMPGADPQIREQITATAEAHGWAAVHAQLQTVDPESARRIHPNDPQRLQRALEIFLVSGKSMTQWHRESHAQQAPSLGPFDLHFLSIQPRSRGVLHDRIAARFRGMVDQGLVAEVEALRGRGDLTLAMPSMRAVGYRQIWQYIVGELAFDAMVEQGIIATRQMAKRQITWLRSWENLQDFDSENPETLELILKFVDRIAI